MGNKSHHLYLRQPLPGAADPGALFATIKQ